MIRVTGRRGYADFSDDGLRRYRLVRIWDAERIPMTFCLLNPSTADADKNDPTIRRCISFAIRERAGGIIVVNRYSLRSTDPKALRDERVVESENLIAVSAAGYDGGGRIVCGWGRPGWKGQAKFVAELDRRRFILQCLGKNRDGTPKHPLYLPKDAELEPL